MHGILRLIKIRFRASRETTVASQLSRREKSVLALLALLFVVIGVMTVVRSAFLISPKTDLQVYARAAWAVRAGEDIYAAMDNNGWHYTYPPAFAIVMAPFADPYPFLSHKGYLPFWASAAIWYVIGFVSVLYTVHVLASLVLPDAVRGSRRWWYARTGPMLFCLSGITLTISRGQVNTVLIALVAAGFASAMRGRRIASGAWLAAAAVMKIIPVLLVLYPILRRDWRAVAGGVAAAAVLLVALPAAVWGVPGAIEANRQTVRLVLAPVLSNDADQSRQFELHGANATHNQSVQGAVHTWMYVNADKRPDTFAPVAKWTHLVSSLAMLAITLVAAKRRLSADPADQLIFLGCLCTMMMLITPISHLHYYAMVLPLVCGLWLRGLSLRPNATAADSRTTWILAAWGIATAIPALPGPFIEWIRNAGFATVATIGLWAYGLKVMGTSRDEAPLNPVC